MSYIFFRTIAILITSYITHVGVPIVMTWSTLWIALLSSLVIAFINHTIKPILHIVTLPINIISLGLFSFVINGSMIVLASKMVDGFIIPTLLTGIWFSVVLSFVNYMLHIFERE